MRAIRSLGIAFLLLPAVLAAAPPGAAAAAPAEPSTLVAIRTGSHAGFDRVVLEFDGPIGTPEARWVAAVRGGSGKAVPLRGDASLKLVVPGVAHDRRGAATVADRPRATDYPILREVRLVGDGGGRLTLGIGTASRTTFKLAALSGPSRLVVDVAHPEGAARAVTAPARPDAGTILASIGGGSGAGGDDANAGPGGVPPAGAWPWVLLGLAALGTVGTAAAARGRRHAARPVDLPPGQAPSRSALTADSARRRMVSSLASQSAASPAIQRAVASSRSGRTE